jgi:hypothetical protein
MMTNLGDYLAVFRKANRCTVHAEVGGTAELLAGARKLGLRTGWLGALRSGQWNRRAKIVAVAGHSSGGNYEPVVRAELDSRFAYLFEPLCFERVSGTTVLTGHVVEQAQLYGFIERTRSSGSSSSRFGRLISHHDHLRNWPARTNYWPATRSGANHGCICTQFVRFEKFVVVRGLF